MPNFLALSLEVRELIYNFVLYAPDDPPPSSPADSGERQQSCEENFHGCSVYFPQALDISSAALLLTNRQIHAEFAPCVARLKKSGRLRYKLDCMLDADDSIYPTWLSVPVVSQHIDVLDIDLRLFGMGEFGSGLMSEWESDLDNYGPMIRCLGALMELFSSRGPAFLSREKDERQWIIVESVALNVIDTPHQDEEFWSRDRCRDTMVSKLEEAALKNVLLMKPQTYLGRLKTIRIRVREDRSTRQRRILKDMLARLRSLVMASRRRNNIVMKEPE